MQTHSKQRCAADSPRVVCSSPVGRSLPREKLTGMAEPFKPLLDWPATILGDTEPQPSAVSKPNVRVALRWVVISILLGVLVGLVAWSYGTSSALSSSVYVERQFNPTLKAITSWEKNNNTCSCEFSHDASESLTITQSSGLGWQSCEICQSDHRQLAIHIGPSYHQDLLG